MTQLRMQDYVLPERVQKAVCLRAKMEWPRRIVLLDAHSNCKYRGKPKWMFNAVYVYVPWLRRQADLSRMIYDHEMDDIARCREIMITQGLKSHCGSFSTATFHK